MIDKETTYDGLPMPRRVYSVVAITLGLFSSMMNSTIANVALPTIGENLMINEADSIWIINAYQIATLVFLLPCSALGEIYSYKKVLLSGLSIFTVASFACSFSKSFETLIFYRILQGVGSAAMVSVNMSLVKLTYPKRYLGSGIGLNSTFVAISSVAGPAIASAVMSFTSWPWLFALNVPVGIFAVLFGLWALPENPIRINRPFPIVDSILNGIFFASLLMFFESVAHDFNVVVIGVLLVATVVAAIAYIPRQMKLEIPLFPFDLLRIRTFRMAVLTSISSFVAQMTAMTAIPFFLQYSLGFSASEAGLLFTAWPFVIMIVAPLSGVLVQKIHPGLLGGFGQALIIAGLFLLAICPSDGDNVTFQVVWRLMLCGAGFGLFQSPNNSIIMQSAPADRNGSASGMLATSRLVGQTSGAMLTSLMFVMFTDNAAQYALFAAAGIAFIACVLSIVRVR